jgi:hypothetical protein
MKRGYLTSVFLILCSSLILLSGCETGPPPKITFEKLQHDFGEIPPNRKKTVQFKFTNTGEGVLKIKKVEPCCGSVTRLVDNKKKYAPGESGTLELDFTSGPKPILFKRELVVYSNDRENPKLQIDILAKIVLSITWEPTKLTLFLDEDNADCPNITVNSLDDQKFSITGFKSTGDCIKADFDPSIKSSDHVLEPKVDLEKLTANPKGQIAIGVDHTDGNTLYIPFEVLSKFTVSPKELLLFGSVSGDPIVKQISVINNYNEEFEIESVVSKSGTIDIKILKQRKIDDGFELEAEMTLKSQQEESLITDEFMVQIKDGVKLSIPCRVWHMKKK